MNDNNTENKPANNGMYMEWTEVISITFHHYNEQNESDADELEIRGLSHEILKGLLEGGLIFEENSVTLKIEHLLWKDARLTQKAGTISGQLYMVGGKFVIRDDHNGDKEYFLYPRYNNAILSSN
jgi:hypothetical protein